MGTFINATALAGSTGVLKTALEGVDLTTVLSEVTDILPIVIPVMIGFIAIRKGLGFLQGVLHSA